MDAGKRAESWRPDEKKWPIRRVGEFRWDLPPNKRLTEAAKAGVLALYYFEGTHEGRADYLPDGLNRLGCAIVAHCMKNPEPTGPGGGGLLGATNAALDFADAGESQVFLSQEEARESLEALMSMPEAKNVQSLRELEFLVWGWNSLYMIRARAYAHTEHTEMTDEQRSAWEGVFLHFVYGQQALSPSFSHANKRRDMLRAWHQRIEAIENVLGTIDFAYQARVVAETMAEEARQLMEEVAADLGISTRRPHGATVLTGEPLSDWDRNCYAFWLRRVHGESFSSIANLAYSNENVSPEEVKRRIKQVSDWLRSASAAIMGDGSGLFRELVVVQVKHRTGQLFPH